MNAQATDAGTIELDSTGSSDSASFITTTDLFTAQFATHAPRAVGNETRLLEVAGVVVAELGTDPSQLNPMCATSAEGMPVVEVLAAIAAQDPTGLLIIESADLKEGFSFEIVGGKVTGARGPGTLGQLEHWCAEVHRCYPDRFDTGDRDDPLWVEVARAFVRERVLDHLALALSPGARLTFVRGDVRWRGTRLPEGKAIALHHLLLEHARRWDELPRILDRLGSLEQRAVPMTEPTATPSEPPPTEGAEQDAWDFFADPDPAALEEWSDALLVWPLCDGQHSLGEIIELALLGRFRGLAALATLVARDHIVLVEGIPASALLLDDRRKGADPSDTDLPAPVGVVLPLRPMPPTPPTPPTPPSEPEAHATEYSLVMRTPKRPRVSPPSTEIQTQEFQSLDVEPPVINPPALKPPSPQAHADVIDAMLAEVEMDDTPPAPTQSPAGRTSAALVIAAVAVGGALFLAGAAVATQL